MTTDIRAELKAKARSKDEGVDVGAVDLSELKQIGPPEDRSIDPAKETTLHSVICRAGYQRNIHRTEGIDYRGLYRDLKAFFESEIVMDERGCEKPSGEPRRSNVRRKKRE